MLFLKSLNLCRQGTEIFNKRQEDIISKIVLLKITSFAQTFSTHPSNQVKNGTLIRYFSTLILLIKIKLIQLKKKHLYLYAKKLIKFLQSKNLKKKKYPKPNWLLKQSILKSNNSSKYSLKSDGDFIILQKSNFLNEIILFKIVCNVYISTLGPVYQKTQYNKNHFI
ncbi:hypothetical protein BpHYR1_029694 [Brachionus plicatilis]|uniref:Uncharacterized protein n=1 Tax=Brachionus plicatilis TaxID=10195 RepID=A0A3M7T3G3_BRAPC|nr:hypothetical protein BpHYR1_029694 [Brachionus plicatilis]